MKPIYTNTLITLMVISYLGLLGFAVWYLKSAWPLIFLLLGLKVRFAEEEKPDAV